MKTCFLSSLALATGLALASAPANAASRPAHVPASYLATPFGYMAPECVTFLKPHETLAGGRIVSKKDSSSRAAGSCAKPRYSRGGAALQAGGMASDATLDGYDLVAGAGLTRGVNFMHAGLTAPAAPAMSGDQSIYLFSSVYNDASPATNALRAVLGWNMFGKGQGWSLASMKLDNTGQLISTPLAPVNPGDPVNLVHDMSDPTGNGVRGPFTTSAYTQDFSQNASIKGSMLEQPANAIAAITMASYGVDDCRKLPAGGSIGGNYSLVQINDVENSDQLIKTVVAQQSFCNMKLTLTDARPNYAPLFSITYSADTPPVSQGRTARITYIAN
ncbi:hypothetical protein GCM10019059_25300 [Camelimonas fluminis]|uniref:Uncharacterized protein n=1 Tax=Camelimonas fluminis TaxID=1576911 RepID=A0ABV7UC71_9HYPH|nr:hypothetical protein [Camelimonas fluminis]GHE64504.1 hypothetical protein GCM10019059_25300 [Camelimonas fluminis]